MVERQARMRMEIAILAFLKHQSLVTRSHNIQPTGVIGHNHLGRLSVGNCPPNRRLVPGPRFGLSSGGSLDRGVATMAAKAPAAGCWSPPGENLCSPVFRPLRENAPAGASQQKPTCTKLL